MNNILIILGMHRSGTSLISRWIHSCGLNLGDRLMGAGIGNINGHYEDIDFHDLHESIFENHSIPHGALQKVGGLSLDHNEKEQLRELVTQKNSLHSDWGWKDPRTCLFISEYARLLPEAAVLVVYRDFNEVVDSLARRHVKELRARRRKVRQSVLQKKLLDYAETWIEYNESILDTIEAESISNYMLVNYTNLLESNLDKDVTQWLSDTGFEIRHTPFSEVYDSSLIQKQPEMYLFPEDIKQRVSELNQRFRSNLIGGEMIPSVEFRQDVFLPQKGLWEKIKSIIRKIFSA